MTEKKISSRGNAEKRTQKIKLWMKFYSAKYFFFILKIICKFYQLHIIVTDNEQRLFPSEFLSPAYYYVK
jgi:hypothetical protein